MDTCREYLQVASMYYLSICIVVCVFCVFILQTGCEFMGSMRFSYVPNVTVEGKRCRTQWDTVCNRGRQPRLENTPGGQSVNAAWGKQVYMHVTVGSIITHKWCVMRIDRLQYRSCLLQYCSGLLYDDVKRRCCNDKHVYNQCLYTLQDTNNAGSSVKLSGLRRRKWRSDATEPDLQYSAGLGAGMSPCGTYVLYCGGGGGAVAPTPSSRLCYGMYA